MHRMYTRFDFAKLYSLIHVKRISRSSDSCRGMKENEETGWSPWKARNKTEENEYSD